jgi:predicted nucleotidyltransferase component of viral defense system
MKSIFQDKFLGSQVAMRGGTLLHKVCMPPAARYSELWKAFHNTDDVKALFM